MWLRWTGRVHHPEAGDEELSCGLFHCILSVPAIAFSGCVSRERSVASVFTRSAPGLLLLLQLVFSLFFRTIVLIGLFVRSL